jgi:hypothetical protein
LAQVPGTYTVATVVTDFNPWAINRQSLSATNSFTVVVSAKHIGPALPVQSDLAVLQYSTVTVTNTAIDSDAPVLALSYGLVNPPTGLTISTNGVITWTPGAGQGNTTNTITTVVTDAGVPALSATNSFMIVVNEINVAPTLPSQPNLTLFGMQPMVVTNAATAPDMPPVTLSYQLVGVVPAGANIDINGVITWTPTAGQVPSTNVFTTVVTDFNPWAVNSQSLSATNSFSVTVNAIHNGPLLPAQNDPTIAANTTMVVTNAAFDSDVPLTGLGYTLMVAPAGAVIDAHGIITWTPTQAQALTTNVFVTLVFDNGSPILSTTNKFTVTVTGTVTAPFMITSVTASNGLAWITWNSVAGQTYRLQYKDTLNAANWQDITPDVVASGSSTTVTNPLGNASQRFYRVMLVQAASVPVIQSINVLGNLATITWSATPSRTYRLQYLGSLGSTNWQEVPADVTAAGATATTSDNLTGVSSRFYRIRLVP